MKKGVKTIISGSLILLIGGISLPFFIIWPIFQLLNEEDFQFKVPGEVQTAVTEPGTYYIWNNYRTVFDGKSYSDTEQIPGGIEIQIKNSNGELLDFTNFTGSSSSGPGGAKRSIGYIEISEPGEVWINVSGNMEERVFSFSQFDFFNFFILIFFGSCLSVLLVVIGILFIVWGIVKVSRRSQSIEQQT